MNNVRIGALIRDRLSLQQLGKTIFLIDFLYQLQLHTGTVGGI